MIKWSLKTLRRETTEMKESVVKKKACLCSKFTNVSLDIFLFSIWKYFPDISDSDLMTYLILPSRGALSTKAL